MPCCAAFGCTNRYKRNMRMFKFPANPIRREIWVENCGRANWYPSQYAVLCQAHFESDQFEANRQDGWRRLKQMAVPTIFSHLPPPRHRKLPKKRQCVEIPPCSKSDTCNAHDHAYVKRCKVQGEAGGSAAESTPDHKDPRTTSPAATETDHCTTPTETNCRTSPTGTDRCNSPTETDRRTSPTETDRRTSLTETDRRASLTETDRCTSPTETDRRTSPTETDRRTSPTETDHCTSLTPSTEINIEGIDSPVHNNEEDQDELSVSPMSDPEDGDLTDTPPASPPSNTFSHMQVSQQVSVSTTSLDFHLKRVRRLQGQVEELRKQLRRKELKNTTLLKNIGQLFNPDQISALSRSSTRGKKWSRDTIEKSLQLQYSCGTKGYEGLLDLGFPLPSLRTLRRHLEGDPYIAELNNSENDIASMNGPSTEEREWEEYVAQEEEGGRAGGSRGRHQHPREPCHHHSQRITPKGSREKTNMEACESELRLLFEADESETGSDTSSEGKTTRRVEEDTEERIGEVEQ